MYWNGDNTEIFMTDITSCTARKVLDAKQVSAVQMVIDEYVKNIKADSISVDPLEGDLRRRIHVGHCGLPVVYIAEYTTHDDYGALRQQEIFAEEEDAWTFLKKEKEDHGATDISVLTRLIYLNSDRTVGM